MNNYPFNILTIYIMETCIKNFQESEDLGYNSLDKIDNLKYKNNISVNIIKEGKVFESWKDVKKKRKRNYR